MTTTIIDYSFFPHYNLGDSLQALVENLAGDFVADFDLEASASRVSEAIDAALRPLGVWVVGDELWGEWGAPRPTDEQVTDALETIDLLGCLVSKQ